ncbi:uncharacterized protein LOC114360333 [Ostrinia furnacalis]|uniref:uncharacterized protein LOC114360333 n=1 Tax=Ostrinia furnacalis TaxID=93504 RepID=UPI0010386C6E|nr:uncharacterized protein LOC114360333 [Ostrinia furnacalis]
MDLKHEVAYRGLPSQVKAEPGVSHNGHPVNGHVREWMAGATGGGSPSPVAVQPQPNNGYSSPLSSSSYGPYSPNGKIAGNGYGLRQMYENCHVINAASEPGLKFTD